MDVIEHKCERCERCDGTGRVSLGDEVLDCEPCDGTGIIVRPPTPEQVARDNPALSEGFGSTRNLAAWLRHLNAS